MKRLHFRIIIFQIFLVSVVTAQQPGTLDSTFNVDGKVVTAVGLTNDRIFAVAMQQDGKIVVGGSSHNGLNFDFALARYNNDGTLDSTFDLDGIVTIAIDTSQEQLWDLVIQSDGKIIACGNSLINGFNEYVMVRYNINGSLDNAFGTNGVQTFSITNTDCYAYSIKIDSKNRIYVGGIAIGANTDLTLLRYDSLGVLDSTFGSAGITITDLGQHEYLGDIALQVDEKIIVAGSGSLADFIVLRYDTSGLLDTSFGTNGIVITSTGANLRSINSVLLEQNGKILIGGGIDNGSGATWDFALVQYNANGVIDSSFGVNGKVITSLSGGRDIIFQIKIQADGKIVAAGHSENPTNYDFGLVRYNANGTLDNTFGNGGKVITNFAGTNDIAFAMAIQPDLKIVAAGETYQNGKWNFALARYISGLNVGVLDFEKKDNGVLIYPNPIKEYATLKYTLVKNEKVGIKLYDVNGRLLKTLLNGAVKEAGEHEEELHFDESIPAGNYILQIENGKGQQGIKIIKE